jgi:hypothetical protein
MINGILSETFMTEYYRNPQNELEFLTYGGTQHEARIKAKHQTCFRLNLRTDMIEFDPDVVRQVCLRPEFKLSLKRIGYLPLGEAGYGTVDRSSMQTKYANTIDTSAERVQEILTNPKIFIEEFSSRFTLPDPSVREPITIRFDFLKRGRVTLYLPKIDFYKPLSDVELERKFYEIVRNAYIYITGGIVSTFSKNGPVFQANAQLTLFESTLDAFLNSINDQDGTNNSSVSENPEETLDDRSSIP